MKLSDIVKFRQSVDKLNIKTTQSCLHDFKDKLVGTMETNDWDFADTKKNIYADIAEIISKLDTIEQNLKKYSGHVSEMQTKMDADYYEESKSIYDATLHDELIYILERSTNTRNEILEKDWNLFISRIKLYTDFRFPGLHIRPLDGTISDHLKALDPLYLVDTNIDYLEQAKTLWSDSYQKRLRYYEIREHDSDPTASLPQEQFSFVLATEFFEYKTIDVIEKYLNSVYKLLKPGGTFLCTFNNCETVKGVRMVESKFCTYTPATKLWQTAHKIGYECTAQITCEPNLSWFELRKPGQLHSIRDGQTLAAIKQLSGPELT